MEPVGKWTGIGTGEKNLIWTWQAELEPGSKPEPVGNKTETGTGKQNRKPAASKTKTGTGKQTGPARQAKPETETDGQAKWNRLLDDVEHGRTKDWIMQQTKVNWRELK